MHAIEKHKPKPAEMRVRPEHLAQLDAIHRLLKALNDPYAAGYTLTALVAELPVLAQRCIHRAIRSSGGRELHSLEQVMTLIGNRGLEGELLNLLEDLTLLKAELDDPRAEPDVRPARTTRVTAPGRSPR